MKYYVYTLADGDKVFYVGKGTNGRIAQHEAEASKGYDEGKTRRYICHCRKCLIIRKIWKAHREVVRTVLFETDNERRAYAYERTMIAKYPLHALCNITHSLRDLSCLKRRVVPAKSVAPDQRAAFYEAEQRKEESGRRTMGSGSVYQNKRGRWCASVRCTDPDGRRWRKKFEDKDRDAVVNKMLLFTQENKVK